MDPILLKALLAGWAIAILAGPMGCFIVWQRMAYFGDTLAHSALLGIGVSLIIESSPTITVLLSSSLIAAALAWLSIKRGLALDTLLGITAHSALAIGILLINLSGSPSVDWLAWLFGDLLALTWAQLTQIAVLVAVVLITLGFFWQRLLSIAVDPELARVEGLPVSALQTLLLVLIAITVATAMQLVGVLLITALLIIPAATARHWAGSPTQMAVIAGVAGLIAVTGGLGASYFYDLSAGPAIVTLAFILFLLSQFRVTR
jgi:zinc transport system permease protein